VSSIKFGGKWYFLQKLNSVIQHVFIKYLLCQATQKYGLNKDGNCPKTKQNKKYKTKQKKQSLMVILN